MTVLTISTIPTIAQTTASILTWSTHISTDGRPQHSQRRKPHSTSQRMKDLHDSQDCCSHENLMARVEQSEALSSKAKPIAFLFKVTKASKTTM
jgi:hypothetical protein